MKRFSKFYTQRSQSIIITDYVLLHLSKYFIMFMSDLIMLHSIIGNNWQENDCWSYLFDGTGVGNEIIWMVASAVRDNWSFWKFGWTIDVSDCVIELFDGTFKQIKFVCKLLCELRSLLISVEPRQGCCMLWQILNSYL